MAWTLCTSGAALIKAGANCASISGAALSEWSDEVEGTINAATRVDWITAISAATIKNNFKNIVADCASSGIAMKIINYDMSGYTSRLEAQTMLDVLRDNYTTTLEILKEKNIQEVM